MPTSEHIGKVQPIKYASILELDKRIREFPKYEFPEDPEEKGLGPNPRILIWHSWKEMSKSLLIHLCFN